MDVLPVRSRILPIIVFSQFACASLWFTWNAVIQDLERNFNLGDGAVGHITSAVQFGFIVGTLVFALFTISDRFSPSKVFFTCALLGALSNLGVLLISKGFVPLLLLRFSTGFFLAGIYPVGMKISADYYEKGLGKALGYLVGALVLGTAFPHLLKAFSLALNWKYVILGTSLLSSVGGILILLFVPDGPYRRAGKKLNLTGFAKVFKNKKFRAAAFGYFGHMWELYAFWAFVPALLMAYQKVNYGVEFNASLYAFLIIGIGGLGCITGGYLSEKTGSKQTAFIALLISGICCLMVPVFFHLPVYIFIAVLLIWGMMVVGDSPQFSTLAAQAADKEIVGTALTIMNSIGFFITIFSIQLLNYLVEIIPVQWIFITLVPGPVLGLMALRRFRNNPQQAIIKK